MKKTTSKKFVPIYEYAEKTGLSRQNVYRLVRESRFDPMDVIVEDVVVRRIRIRDGALPAYKNANGKLAMPGQ